MVPNNLPTRLSSFIGREDDLAFSQRLVRDARLLTLTGSGGCGKTRLALRIAGNMSAAFADGVWWVALDSLPDGTLVADAVADAMDARVLAERSATEVVLERIASHESMLILDNCEHVIDSVAPFVAQVLQAAPHVRVLSTSREPLAVEGEVTWKVPPLSVPPDDSVDLDDAVRHDAVRMFVERAREVAPHFTLTDENIQAVVAICRQVGGIPLAIELAAAQTAVMTTSEIAEGLQDQLRLLAGSTYGAVPRQQTLQASIEWSYQLLDDETRVLFRRLAPFAGGFTLAAATTVCGGNDLASSNVSDVLLTLVKKSLVQADHSSSHRRYRMLESVRQYALDELQRYEEHDTVRGKHLTWFVDLAESLEAGATNAHADSLAQLDLEQPNARVALDWAANSGKSEQFLRLIAALGFYWARRGHFAEAGQWMAACDDRSDGADSYVARALWMRAYVASMSADANTVGELAKIALAAARAADDRMTEARALQTVANPLIVSDPPAGSGFAAEATAIARAMGDRWCESNSQHVLAWCLVNQGRAAEAQDALARGLPLVERLDNDLMRAYHHVILGVAAFCTLDWKTSRAELGLGLGIARSVRDPLLETTACAMDAYSFVLMGRPGDLRAITRGLTDRNREWGARGDGLLLMLDALGQIVDQPSQAATTLAMVGEALFSIGDVANGSCVMLASALAALEHGDTEAAEPLARQALDAAQRVDVITTPGLDVILGRLALGRGDRAAAEEHGHSALAFQRERGLRVWVAEALDLLGAAAIAAESWAEGTRLVAAANAYRAESTQQRLPRAQHEVEWSLAQARRATGESTFEQCRQEGAALSVDDAIAYAGRARGERKRPSFGWDSLTPTELEVVRFVARGLTNRAIAERMFIGSGTVKTHLAHVFGKLGVHSRAELAAEASKRHLT